MSESDEIGPYVLGIDLGSHSLGWAVLPLGSDGQPCGLEAAGVRTFEAGVQASYDQMIQGKQESKAAHRRSKRGPRRQFWRRAWRRYKVLKCLTSHGLLRDPEGPNPDDFDLRAPADQDRFLKAADDVLRKRLRPSKDDPRRHLWEQIWPYELRALALERKLDPLELGRALYHLAQRRGFLSNRKTEVPTNDDDQPKKPKRGKKDTASRAELPRHETDRQEAETPDVTMEDPKKVKQAIAKLGQDIEKAISDPRFRTLGFYFARCVNPEEHRIRARWASREMYKQEFKAICDAQTPCHPGLAEGQPFRDELQDAIFHQRPLKPCGHLVGHCDLEPGRKRALQAIPIAQRFRLLQKVNDLRVLPPEGRQERPLHDDERDKLIMELSTRGDMTFDAIRELLGFVKTKIDKKTGEVTRFGYDFNLDRPPIEKLPGDRTTAKILALDKKAPGIAARWSEMADRREELVLLMVESETDADLARHLRDRFGFTDEQAAVLSKIRLEESRCLLSRRAISRLLPFMEDGMPFATAKERIPEYRAKTARQLAVHDLLPRILATDERHVPSRDGQHPAFKRARDLRNPAVTRALAELRKVVNAVIRRYGKPERIHIELGRELKKTAKERERLAKENEKRRDARAKAVDDMQKEIQLSNPSENDKRKWLLGLEQNWHCPYCGQPLSRRAVASGELQIDHIIPESISLDGNMANLVLCHADCNQRKAKRAPCQAFDEEQLQEIAKNTVALPPGKRRRFLWTEEDIREYYGDESGGFTKRQLQDTQWASRLAGEYLGLLYGGVIDETGRCRVQVSPGAVTAILRQEWNLNGVIPSLPDSPAQKAPQDIRLDEKLRTDHRHHAVDAIVIASTSPKTVRLLSDAAARVEQAELRREDIRDSQGRRRTRYAEIAPPWGSKDSFVAQVKTAISAIRVSRRQERKIQGPLHAETNYSREISDRGEKTRRQRVPLMALSIKDIEGDVIADPVVREVVRAKWRELGGGKPKDVFKNAENHPRMPARPGRHSPSIHTVRINVSITPITVGHGCRQRFVISGKDTLHHTVIVATQTPRGERWRDEPVDRLEVLRRRRDRRPLIQRDWGADEFVMCLCKDDCIEMDDGEGGRAIYVVKAISKGDIKVRLHHDGRTDEQIKAAGERQKFRISSADTLRKRNACRVIIDPLGNVQRIRRGHD